MEEHSRSLFCFKAVFYSEVSRPVKKTAFEEAGAMVTESVAALVVTVTTQYLSLLFE